MTDHSPAAGSEHPPRRDTLTILQRLRDGSEHELAVRVAGLDVEPHPLQTASRNAARVLAAAAEHTAPARDLRPEEIATPQRTGFNGRALKARPGILTGLEPGGADTGLPGI